MYNIDLIGIDLVTINNIEGSAVNDEIGIGKHRYR
jgi:hypothetical protein